ncbi:hypothetical protein HanIR_Chr15g0744861 [Helianthus annuus]|nr:hypothetical protein HanIR_Chr15g0744861 [Helianthus annuus]
MRINLQTGNRSMGIQPFNKKIKENLNTNNRNAHQKILWLNVSVTNTYCMNICQSSKYLKRSRVHIIF